LASFLMRPKLGRIILFLPVRQRDPHRDLLVALQCRQLGTMQVFGAPLASQRWPIRHAIIFPVPSHSGQFFQMVVEGGFLADFGFPPEIAPADFVT
jgi:hypothetical protein